MSRAKLVSSSSSLSFDLPQRSARAGEIFPEAGLDEHAVEQRRHGPVQRDVVRRGENVAAN